MIGYEDYLPLNVAVVRQDRPKAVQIILDDGRIWWLPRSQVINGGDLYAGQRNILIFAAFWLVQERALDSFTPMVAGEVFLAAS